MPPIQRYFDFEEFLDPVFERLGEASQTFHKMQKTSGQCHINETLWLFLLFLLFFSGKLSARDVSFSAEILDRRRFDERENSEAFGFSFAVSRWFRQKRQVSRR